MNRSTTPTPRIVVLISGNGSNLQALIDAIDNKTLNATITGVISNVKSAYGLERAQKHGIDTTAIDHRDYADRETFDLALQAQIDAYQPDLVVLAGFMRILTPNFVRYFSGRLLNIHPSLLPKYKGLNTHQRALDAQDTEHGCSIHFVTLELDGGPVICQGAVAIELGDTAESLAHKVQHHEHRLYPLVCELFLHGHITLDNDNVTLSKTAVTQLHDHNALQGTHPS